MIDLEQILGKHDRYDDISEALLPSILAAMKEACLQAVDLCNETTRPVYDISKISDYILNVKNLIK